MSFWIAPPPGTRAASACPKRAGEAWRGDGRRGSPFSLLKLLVALDVQSHARHDPLQAAVLFLKRLEFRQLAPGHPRVASSPFVQRLHPDAVRPPHGSDRRSRLDLLQNLQDLLLRVP